MIPAWSTAAWVLHDLGLATNFGGTLFGQLALPPAVREVSSRKERGEVMGAAWTRFRWVELASVLVAAGSWIAGRSRLSGREIDRSTRGLVLAKDALMGALVVSTAGAYTAGALLERERERAPFPLNETGGPAADAPRRARAFKRATGAFGAVHMIAAAGILGVTTLLSMKSGQSTRWAFLSRFLP